MFTFFYMQSYEDAPFIVWDSPHFHEVSIHAHLRDKWDVEFIFLRCYTHEEWEGVGETRNEKLFMN